MNKKGFSLVELLAAVFVLSLLVVIIAPNVINLLGDSEDTLYDEQINMVINATKKYMVEHSELLPEFNNVLSIDLNDLISEGVIDNDKIINPKTKEELGGCVVVSYSNEFNQYEYNYYDGESLLCDSNVMVAYRNVTTGSYYQTLEEAFNNLQSDVENTIRVVRNVNDSSSESPTVEDGKNVILDLNGHTLTMDKSITNNGNLTVTGSGELTNSTTANITNTITGAFTKEGVSVISNTGSSYYIINNQGLATFSDGKVIAGYRAINNQTNGRLVVSGASISSNDMAIYNVGRASSSSEPSVLISSGTITSSLKQGIQNASTGTVYMSDGVVTSNGANTYGIQNSSGGNVTITGGTINAAYRCIRNASSSTLVIEEGTFSAVGVSGNTYSTQSLSLAGGTINISGGTFNVNKGSSASSNIVELENNTTPNVTITGGTFTSDGGGIAVNGAGTLEVGGTASITAVNNGINNVRAGTVNIKGGSITSTSEIGVKNSNASGTITIGLDDSDVSTTSPIITGKKYGVQIQAGTFNFYDGVITGPTDNAISGSVTGLPNGYSISRTNSNGKQTAILTSN